MTVNTGISLSASEVSSIVNLPSGEFTVNNGAFNIGAGPLTGNYNGSDLCNAYWHYYHYPVVEKVDVTKKAFTLVQELMDKKFLKINTIKEFIDVVAIIVTQIQ